MIQKPTYFAKIFTSFYSTQLIACSEIISHFMSPDQYKLLEDLNVKLFLKRKKIQELINFANNLKAS